MLNHFVSHHPVLTAAVVIWSLSCLMTCAMVGLELRREKRLANPPSNPDSL